MTDEKNKVNIEVVDIDTLLQDTHNFNLGTEQGQQLIEKSFSEACVNLTQMLGDNFYGKEKQKAIKRAIHTFNLNTTLVPHVHDKKYGYTSEDEKEWDNFCELIYGTDLK